MRQANNYIILSICCNFTYLRLTDYNWRKHELQKERYKLPFSETMGQARYLPMPPLRIRNNPATITAQPNSVSMQF